MSLINDALRRATKNQPRNPHDMIKLQPTKQQKEQQPPPQRTPAEPKTGGSGLKSFFILVLLAGAGYGGWYYYTHYKNPPASANGSATAEKTKLTTNNNPIARAAATLMKIGQANKEGENTADQIQPGGTKASAPANAQTASAAPGSKTQPWSAIPGMPRLQAIFYKPVDPTAMIDGKIVKVGDEIGGAKVVEIKKASVRMQLGSDVHDVSIK